MTDIKGIDFAWAKPSPQNVKDIGAGWVAGYISNDPSKDLTESEVHEYTSAGIPVVLVNETTATRALYGMHAGIADAQASMQRVRDLKMPGAMVYYAVDTDATWQQVQTYFEGVFNQTQNKNLIGVYGGLHVIEGAHAWGLKYLWQTTAWSNGQWSEFTTIRQEGGELFAGSADWDTAMVPDWGQWPRFTVITQRINYEENDVLAYFNVPAGKSIDIPVEPAGTDAAPKGGARNGQMWLSGCPSGGAVGTLKLTYHTYKGGWGTVSETPVVGTADKWTVALPSDGTVDKVRLECDVDFTAYIVGRQVQ